MSEVLAKSVNLVVTIWTSCFDCFPIDDTPYSRVFTGYNLDKAGQVPNINGLAFGSTSGEDREEWHER